MIIDNVIDNTWISQVHQIDANIIYVMHVNGQCILHDLIGDSMMTKTF